MSSSVCQFHLILEGCIQSLVPRARQAVLDAGGAFTGDQYGGLFTVPTPLGAVRGTYRIEGVSCDLRILERPDALTCEILRGQLRALQVRMHALQTEA